jgi:AcrR family transcriptional regulator
VIPSAAASDLSERARAQRERILGSAKRCFAEHGFHAASMADIAKTAGMSAGLLYRYFDSKAAIVRAIIDRQMEENRCVLDEVSSARDLVAALLDLYEKWTGSEEARGAAALFLDITAEATRDAEIGDALRAADGHARARLAEVLQRTTGTATHPTGPRESGAAAADPSQVARRVLALQCAIEGLLVRAVRQPDLDRATLAACLETVLAAFATG